MDLAGLFERRFRFALLAVLAAGVLVYLNGLTNPFSNWDDPLYVTANPRVQDWSLRGLLQLWSPRAALAGEYIEFFPLRDTIYAAIFRLFGLNPVPYHVVGVGLHAVDSVLVALLARRLGAQAFGATAAGLLFAVHAVHVESVIWIAGLKDPLYTFFFLVAVLSWLRFREGGQARHLLLALAAYAAGFLVKALILVLPLALFLVDQALPPRRPLKQTILALVPFVLVTIPFMALILSVARANDVISEYPGGSFYTGMLTTAWSLVVYLSKAVLPVGLNPRYVMHPVVSALEQRALVSFALLGLLAVLAWRTRRTRPENLFALSWYFGALAPVVNFIPHRIEVADRYQYVSTIALCFWFGLFVERLAARAPRAAVAVVASTTVLFGALTVRQNVVWSDDLVLWRTVAAQEDAELKPFIFNMLGTSLKQKGMHDEAMAMFERAIGREDDPFEHIPRTNLARELLARGDVEGARAHVLHALAQNPRFAPAHATLAAIERARGDLGASRAAYSRALELEPRAASHAWNRALVEVARKDWQTAAADMRVALSIDPSLCERFARFVADLSGKEPDGAAVVGAAADACPQRR